MIICYFGDYDPEYSRNRVIIKGLRANGVVVHECNVRALGLEKYGKLFKSHRATGNYDAMIVGYSNSRSVMLFAKMIARGPVVWDAFYSIYDMWVNDRKLVSRFSIKAAYYWFFDQLCCIFADKILLDTNAHIDYFLKTFFVRKNKFSRIFVGTDDAIFFPRNSEKREDDFLVHFHGKFIPLQGIMYIVQAAALVQDNGVRFQIIGKGQEYAKAREMAERLNVRSITWIDRVPYSELPAYMGNADVCLGIFGDTGKTMQVIPNKVYEAIAMKKPVITADTPAIRELFSHKKDMFLCERADAQSISNAILELKNNVILRNEIAEGGYDIFQENGIPMVLGKAAKNILESSI